MASFIIPRETYFGSGVVAQLGKLKGEKATIVIGGGSIKKNGGLARIEAELRGAGIDTQVIEGVESDPTIQTVLAGVERMREFGPDLIVGVGGGSPIDAAKAMWLFYEQPDMTLEKAAVPFSLPTLRRKARFVAVSTTSGTGTEVTSFSVITDGETGIKYPIADYNLTPDVAIVDTDLSADLPSRLVAHTGMDALTHSIEAYVSNVSNDLTDALAIKSIEMIDQYIKPSYYGDTEARGKMHIAQCLAGMSFSNAILGIVHSMAHKSGSILDLPHGCANAIFLPHVIAYNAAEAPAKYAEIADRLGLAGDTDQEKATALAAHIETMNKALDIPSTLAEFGVDEAFFKENLERMAEGAVADPCTGTNPRCIDKEAMRTLFELAYYGK
ncbi:Aldehyde-alcohol dehydrogenase [Pseudodesulfovibrio hydrargyri]|uniref:Aldehyde-alcohol dehydrogenase n=1 Tax=Pseudodesulfovibrio hydrargyri TaxID=2125990 RepID=A0A1J5MU91_9BACT|nr:iron-containing alcohol dehydrogenase [Pseudodesulfovibrio hydrargyri]OIQ50197.1 Aldehyde-alcohol dehydrogenase [Pseudodesulfovibrio hydrargyri]